MLGVGGFFLSRAKYAVGVAFRGNIQRNDRLPGPDVRLLAICKSCWHIAELEIPALRMGAVWGLGPVKGFSVDGRSPPEP